MVCPRLIGSKNPTRPHNRQVRPTRFLPMFYTQNRNPRIIAHTKLSPYKLLPNPKYTLTRTRRRILHNKPNPAQPNLLFLSPPLNNPPSAAAPCNLGSSGRPEDQLQEVVLVANGDHRKPRRRRWPCDEPNQQANPRLPQEDEPHRRHGRGRLPGENIEQGAGRVSPHQTLYSRPHRRVREASAAPRLCGSRGTPGSGAERAKR